MSILRAALHQVLSGQTTIKSAGEIEMLRKVANIEEQDRLSELEREFWKRDRQKPQPLTATERIFVELLKPTPRPTSLPAQTAAEPMRADVQQILNHPCDASIAELEDVLRRAKALKISSGEEESIRQLLSQLAGEKFRGELRPSELKRLGWQETPVGPADPGTVQSLNRLRCVALARIESCQGHVRNCACYDNVRENLLQIVRAFTDSQPEGWLALRILGELEAYGPTTKHQER